MQTPESMGHPTGQRTIISRDAGWARRDWGMGTEIRRWLNPKHSYVTSHRNEVYNSHMYFPHCFDIYWYLFYILSIFFLPLSHSPASQYAVDGNLGSFHFGDVMNNAAMNILPVFVWVYVFISLGHIPSFMELLGHKVTLWLTFGGTAKLFSKVAALFYIPTYNVWRFQFLAISCYYLSFW